MSRHTARVLATTLGAALLWLALSASRATCVPIEPQEPACDPDVLTFPQDNPQLFEFYEVCLPRDAAGAQDELRAIDPTLYCGVAGVFAGCDRQREQGCHGDLTYAGPDTRRISDEKWAQLCALSVHPLVTRVGGGHWVQ